MPKSLYVDPDKMRAEGKITFKDIPINVYKKSVKEEVEEGNYTKEDLLRIYRDMSICREFEDMLNQIKTQANMRTLRQLIRVRPICPWDRRRRSRRGLSVGQRGLHLRKPQKPQ